MYCGKRGTGTSASFVPLSVSFHQFLFVFILTQLLWRGQVGGAREPSDEVIGVEHRGAFDDQYSRSSVYGPDLFLESCTQAENSLD